MRHEYVTDYGIDGGGKVLVTSWVDEGSGGMMTSPIVKVDPAEVKVVTAAARGEPGGAWQLRDRDGRWVDMVAARGAVRQVVAAHCARTGVSDDFCRAFLRDIEEETDAFWVDQADLTRGTIASQSTRDASLPGRLADHWVASGLAIDQVGAERMAGDILALTNDPMLVEDQYLVDAPLATEEQVAEIEAEEGGPAQAEPLPVSEYTPEQQQVAGDAVARVQGLVDDGVFADSALVPAQLRGGTAALLNQMATGQLYDPETGFPVTSFQSMSDAVAGRVIRGHLGEGLSDGDVLAYQTAGGEIEARLDGVPTLPPANQFVERAFAAADEREELGSPAQEAEEFRVAAQEMSTRPPGRVVTEDQLQAEMRAAFEFAGRDPMNSLNAWQGPTMRRHLLETGMVTIESPPPPAPVDDVQAAIDTYDDEAVGSGDSYVRLNASLEPSNDVGVYEALYDPDAEGEDAQNRMLIAAEDTLGTFEGRTVNQDDLYSAALESLDGNTEEAERVVDAIYGSSILEPDSGLTTRDLVERFRTEYENSMEWGDADADAVWQNVLRYETDRMELAPARADELYYNTPYDVAAAIDDSAGLSLPNGEKFNVAKATETLGGLSGDSGTDAGAVYFDVEDVVYTGTEITVEAGIYTEEFGRIGKTKLDLQDGGGVYAALMEIDPEFQGHGAATVAQIEGFKALKDAGFTHLTVSANMSVGGYTWASDGWEYDFDRAGESGYRQLIDKIEQTTQSLGPAADVTEAEPPPEWVPPESREMLIEGLERVRSGVGDVVGAEAAEGVQALIDQGIRRASDPDWNPAVETSYPTIGALRARNSIQALPRDQQDLVLGLMRGAGFIRPTPAPPPSRGGLGIYTETQVSEVLSEVAEARAALDRGEPWSMQRLSRIGQRYTYGTTEDEPSTYLQIIEEQREDWEKWHHWPGKAGLLGTSWSGRMDL